MPLEQFHGELLSSLQVAAAAGLAQRRLEASDPVHCELFEEFHAELLLAAQDAAELTRCSAQAEELRGALARAEASLEQGRAAILHAPVALAPRHADYVVYGQNLGHRSPRTLRSRSPATLGWETWGFDGEVAPTSAMQDMQALHKARADLDKHRSGLQALIRQRQLLRQARAELRELHRKGFADQGGEASEGREATSRRADPMGELAQRGSGSEALQEAAGFEESRPSQGLVELTGELKQPGSDEQSAPSPPPPVSTIALRYRGGIKPLLSGLMAECVSEYLPVTLRIPGAVEWVLRYTPKAHGVSLSTLYRNLGNYEKSVVLVQDTAFRVFGGFAPEAWEPKGKFFGGAEAFVFTFTSLSAECPQLQLFPWTSKNNYVMYADRSCLGMGGGDGRHAFAIEGDLLRGTSSPTPTFANPVLAASKEFVVRDMEVWSLEEVG